MRLSNLNIVYKLALGFGCILAVFAGASLVLFSALASVETSESTNTTAQNLLIDLEQATAAIYDESQTARGFVISRIERHAGLYAAASKTFDEKITKARADAALSPYPADKDAIETLATAADRWRQNVGDPEVKFTRDPATVQQGIEVAKSPVSSGFMQGFRDALAAARGLINRELTESQSAQDRALGFARIVQGAGGVLATIASLLVGWALYRMIARPIQGMTEAMGVLAAGKTDIVVPAQGRTDEVGMMADAVENFRRAALDKIELEAESARSRQTLEDERLVRERGNEDQRRHSEHAVATLSEALEQLASGDLTFRVKSPLHGTSDLLRLNFNKSAEKLQQTMSTVSANTQAIHIGTREIATASDSLSLRTEQQAASLEETAAALDQITLTIKRTAAGSEHAHQVVSNATAQARQGEAIVRQAIEAMNGIETSSKQITQIIGAIDEIAFQTNLLALNAGVEAARAGDAGRGFAVVASEVRGLAQRSAEAAKEIKALIAVSTTNVSRGVALVAETGHALERILEQVENISGVVSEIAAGAKEQSVGLQEVNTAVTQMDRATQQNAAMVEESTAASRAMAQETDALADLIGTFQLGESSLEHESGTLPDRAAGKPKRAA